MADNVITVRGLGKRYHLGATVGGPSYKTLRDLMESTIKAPFRLFSKNQRKTGESENSEHIWALKDVSLDIQRGEVVGVIGKNGAGKTTLLKILSQITDPTEGEIRIRGRVASLLQVGTGFHPELTGRENIFMNGAILGMTRAEIKQKFDEIVAFAEVEKFIDTPVKRYSSGMYVRLAFSVAAHLEPEILLVDEVLAVGDVAFQKKCLGKMGHVASEGRTILFVSHNMSAIASLCERVILLRDGSLVADGPASSTISAYLLDSSADKIEKGEAVFSETDFGSENPFILRSIRTLDQKGRVRSDFSNLEPITIEFEFSLREKVPDLLIGFEFKTASEIVAFRALHNDVMEVLTYRNDPAFRYKLQTVIPKGFLNGGLFYIDPCIGMRKKKWLIKDARILSINVVFDVPNPDIVVVVSSRPGCLAPMLEWSEGRVHE